MWEERWENVGRNDMSWYLCFSVCSTICRGVWLACSHGLCSAVCRGVWQACSHGFCNTICRTVWLACSHGLCSTICRVWLACSHGLCSTICRGGVGWLVLMTFTGLSWYWCFSLFVGGCGLACSHGFHTLSERQPSKRQSKQLRRLLRRQMKMGRTKRKMSRKFQSRWVLCTLMMYNYNNFRPCQCALGHASVLSCFVDLLYVCLCVCVE